MSSHFVCFQGFSCLIVHLYCVCLELRARVGSWPMFNDNAFETSASHIIYTWEKLPQGLTMSCILFVTFLFILPWICLDLCACVGLSPCHFCELLAFVCLHHICCAALSLATVSSICVSLLGHRHRWTSCAQFQRQWPRFHSDFDIICPFTVSKGGGRRCMRWNFQPKKRCLIFIFLQLLILKYMINIPT